MKIIENNLTINNNTGNIIEYDQLDLEGKKLLVDLYFIHSEDTVPFNDGGNKLTRKLLKADSDEFRSFILSEVTNKLNKQFNLKIVKSDIYRQDRELYIGFLLENGDIIGKKIS